MTRITYLNITKSAPTRDLIYIKALRRQGVVVNEHLCAEPGFRKIIRLCGAFIVDGRGADLVWVGYTGGILVPFIRILTLKKIFFNAYSSLYEGMIISRRAGGRFSWTSVKYWLLDFLSFHFASTISAETESQKLFLNRLFLLPRKKIIVVMTGADDEFFFKEAAAKLPKFTVIFRGGLLPEAGISVFVQAAASIIKNGRSDIGFKIVGFGFEEKLMKSLIAKLRLGDIIEHDGERRTQDELRRLMQECHVSLGQLADHPRLKRTIPHKAFETLAIGLPYLTARTPGILELLKENETCLCFKPSDPDDLARAIMQACDDAEGTRRIADTGYLLYRESLRSDTLAKKLLKSLIKQ